VVLWELSGSGQDRQRRALRLIGGAFVALAVYLTIQAVLVLVTEGRVTLVDGILAVAVLAGLVLNAAAGWWQADPLAALIIVAYALREAREIF
jgi:divalent metal cation (Fe/Co/Zn/Cd) transporter